MTHLKRQKTPRKWPVTKKGTKYVVRTPEMNKGLPALIILRDMLKVVQNRKELKKSINAKHVLVNWKPIIDVRKSVLLLDVITLVPSKKNYRLGLSKTGKFEIVEIPEKESVIKISKIVNKKILKGKKTQLNLSDGRNILSEIKCDVDDSVLIDLKNRKIEKCIPLREGTKAIIFEGKHSGKSGVIKKIAKEKKIAELDVDGKKTNVLIKQFMAVE
ncbi:MAG: hypothetical protein Q8P15_01495 [Nanoarchaeota archaeon]|nr:hypothetical protein [Nanoarchaeota archaeon]